MLFRSPINYSVDFLNKSELKREKYFKNYKTKKLTNDNHINYYVNATNNMHKKRQERFNTMMKNDFDRSSPFDRNISLPTILKKYKFI